MKGIMKNRILVLCAVGLALLMVTGCGPSGGGSGGSSSHPCSRGGKGLNVEFDDTNTLEVYDGRKDLDLRMYFCNFGYQEPRNPRYFITANRNYFKGLGQSGAIPPTGARIEKTPYAFSEAVEHISEVSLPVDKGGLEGNFETSIKVSACYDYTTLTTIQTCASPDKYSDEACTPFATIKNVQDAPVEVTGVSESINAGVATIEFRLRDVGGGRVVDTSKCPDNFRISDWDTIRIDEIKFDGEAISRPCSSDSRNCCTPSDKVTLFNGEGTVTCFKDLTGKQSDATVQSRFSYGYKYPVVKQVVIKT
ncbi:hypothetical protein COY95_02060 [Candidatus Woesearchaeota archaeon CG_4_10_14_0_8_um_filter_47_5]|nr:MAG: hypothetical protein COY95_02060 [Candidatus Woesearchaeota archaeon CG_4_10_14_0_8_um_filter_47_5]